MPLLPLAGGERNRRAGVLPRFRLRNLFIEPDPSNTLDGVVRLQRPGLEAWLTVGSGPINAVFQQDGTFGGDWFVLSGAELYRINSAGTATLIGTAANERAQITATADRLLLVNGGFARSYDGATWQTVILPEGFLAQSVAYLAGFFVITCQGSGRVYFMAEGESDPDPLSFFEAERLPDAIITAAVNGDELWLIGVQSEEVWVPSGEATQPFERAPGRAYENGCLNRDTLVQVDNVLIYVGRDGNVVAAAGVPQPISEPDIAEAVRLAAPQSLRAWLFKLDMHIFYVMTSDRDTLVYDLSTKTWMRFASHNVDTWRAHLGSGLVAGDATTGALYRLIPGRSNDVGDAMDREVTGGIENVGAPVRCDSVALRLIVGNSSLGTGPATYVLGLGVWDDGLPWDDAGEWRDNPPVTRLASVEMRWSDDEGRLWTDWRSISLGLEGQYRQPVVFRKLGLIRRPGRLFQFRATDDVEFRISHATMNEAVN